MSAPLYFLRGVEAAYTGAAQGAAVVLHLPELAIARGSILGLVGHNGSGKSTLLKLLGFLLEPTAGVLEFDGRVVDSAARRAGHVLRRQAVLLGQDTCLLKRSVAANVAYGLRLRGLPAPAAVLAEALALVGLDFAEFGARSWRQLSGGEARRVALAARLVLDPAALLLDEPTAGLDRASVAHVQSAVLAARERGASLVISSHDQDWLKSCADTVLVLEDGRITGSL
ncbi:MAG: ABC transporter ATP-binding protein [Desulfovibrio sp.]|nr:ABC transporter ATP-binding protein [Desulfovibrio sp.]